MHIHIVPGEFLDSSTNISVLFTASLIPLVNINIEVFILLVGNLLSLLINFCTAAMAHM